MQQEAAHELRHREGHAPIAATALGPVVLELEGDAFLIVCDQPAVGDGHAVGVARQIGEHRLRSGEGALGIDHPVAVAQRLQERGERFGLCQRLVLAEELELTGPVGGIELLAEEPPEQPREHPHGQEEAAPAGNPTFAVA
jgi:hypothetical protein